MGRGLEDQTAESGRDRIEGTTSHVQTGTTSIDRMGAAVRLITMDRRLLYSGLCVHDKLITEEPPIFLNEVAVIRSLRALHAWMHSRAAEQTRVARIYMRAGNAASIGALAPN